MKKKVFMILAALIMTAAYYGVHVKHNLKHGLTDLALLNVEALAEYEAEPIKLKSCYIYTSTTLLPDEPEMYVTKCSGCHGTKSTTHIYLAKCVGSQIIY